MSSHIAPGWQVLNNYISAAKIWLIWDPNYYTVTLLRAEAKVSHCLVKGIIGDQECLLSVIYGYNTIEQRKQLQTDRDWTGDLQPWLIGGDFNFVLHLQERLHGNPKSLVEVQDFKKCVQDLGLNELAWEGVYYTWPNKEAGIDGIWSRIYRLFGN